MRFPITIAGLCIVATLGLAGDMLWEYDTGG